MKKILQDGKKYMNTLHLVVTSLCDRQCRWCCNKQYDIKNLEYATDEDFRWAEMLCLTGGEPFEYANPCNLAKYYKLRYRNIKYVIAYSNAFELSEYLYNGGKTYAIDGINVSVKDDDDLAYLRSVVTNIYYLPMNRIYDFTGRAKDELASIMWDDGFKLSCKHPFEIINRQWQENFVPAPNCRFRRGN